MFFSVSILVLDQRCSDAGVTGTTPGWARAGRHIFLPVLTVVACECVCCHGISRKNLEETFWREEEEGNARHRHVKAYLSSAECSGPWAAETVANGCGAVDALVATHRVHANERQPSLSLCRGCSHTRGRNRLALTSSSLFISGTLQAGGHPGISLDHHCHC